MESPAEILYRNGTGNDQAPAAPDKANLAAERIWEHSGWLESTYNHYYELIALAIGVGGGRAGEGRQ